MKNIKFRTWCKKREVFDTKLCLYLDDSEIGDVSECFHNLESKETYVLQQYTGINDKNKKEIYEGDILEFNGERGFVHFCCGAFFIDGAGPMYDHVKSVTPDILEDWVVIGNIYENTHLLDYK